MFQTFKAHAVLRSLEVGISKHWRSGAPEAVWQVWRPPYQSKI